MLQRLTSFFKDTASNPSSSPSTPLPSKNMNCPDHHHRNDGSHGDGSGGNDGVKRKSANAARLSPKRNIEQTSQHPKSVNPNRAFEVKAGNKTATVRTTAKPWIEKQKLAKARREQILQHLHLENQLAAEVVDGGSHASDSNYGLFVQSLQRRVSESRKGNLAKDMGVKMGERYRNAKTATFGSQVEVMKGQVLPEYYLKIVVLGAPSVGKSLLVRRYVTGQVNSASRPTVGVNVQTCRLKRDKKILRKLQMPVRIKLFDVPHAELTGKNLSSIFNDAHGVIMMFDVTNMRSIEAVDQWRAVIPSAVAHSVLLCAHKSDKDFSRHVITPTGLDAYARDCGYVGWYMTSVKSDSTSRVAIDYLVDRVLRHMLHKYDRLPVESIRFHMMRSLPRGLPNAKTKYQQDYIFASPASPSAPTICVSQAMGKRPSESMDDNAVAGSFLSSHHRNISLPNNRHMEGRYSASSPPSSPLSQFSNILSLSQSDLTDDQSVSQTMDIIAHMDDDILFHQHHQQTHRLRTVVEEMETNPFSGKDNVEGGQHGHGSSDTSSISSSSSSSSNHTRTTVAANLDADIHELVRNSSTSNNDHSQTGRFLEQMLVPLSKKRKTVSPLVDEIIVFFVQVKARFTEYLEFVKKNDTLDPKDVAVRRELIHLIMDECAVEEERLLSKLSTVLEAYREDRAGNISEDVYMRRMFIEQKRTFYTDVMNRYISLWQSFKQEMSLHELTRCRLLSIDTCTRLLEQLRERAHKGATHTGATAPGVSFTSDSENAALNTLGMSSDFFYRFRFASLNDFFEISSDESTSIEMLKPKHPVPNMFRPQSTGFAFGFKNNVDKDSLSNQDI